MNLARLLSETASRHPDKPAVVFEGTSHSYRAFDRQGGGHAALPHADGGGSGGAAGPIRGLKGVRTLLVDDAVAEGAGTLPDRLARAPSRFRRAYPTGGDDVAMICYTSGTTGRAKGAMITPRNLVANMRGLSG